jgi:hypothetical protein
MFFPPLQAVTNGTRFLNQGCSYVAIPRSFQYCRNFVRALAENALDLDKGVYSKIAIGDKAMSALAHFADPSRTFPEVREVPQKLP